MSRQGMVATGHPLASIAAIDVLKDGGNAFDAALCASAVLSVVKSYHCGLGGDLFGIFYSAQDRTVLVVNGSGRSPRLIRRNSFSDHIPHRGILAASTPGTVDAWFEIAARLGSRTVKDLLKPAIEYAETGFPVFPHLRSVIQSSQKTLGSDPVWAKIFLPEGQPPEIGDILVQRDLAISLSQIAAGGREAFYSGQIAESIVRTSVRNRGCFSAADFSEHRSRWEEPLRASYRGHDVCVPPPNSYGLLLLLQLKFLADYDLVRYEHNTPEYVRLQVKAKDEAWRNSQFWIGDPEQYRRKDILELINGYPAYKNPPDAYVAPKKQGSDTTYIAAADSNGNWASVIQSVHQSFGCGTVAGGTGIVLNNRMTGFNLIPGHPNELAPGKRPAHTLSPALILKENTPVLAIGTPGGLGQTQFLTQMLCNLFDFNMNIQEAVEAPRWQSEAERHVDLESRFSTEVRDFLIHQAYDVKVCGPWEFAFGGAEAVALHKNGQVLMGAADPRRDGYAIGW
jgi:gamma-glutamyltranspeptidase/glutathione hydrolase